jgi:Ser/Thr protein kinase RdoA (MazF antagonist)
MDCGEAATSAPARRPITGRSGRGTDVVAGPHGRPHAARGRPDGPAAVSAPACDWLAGLAGTLFGVRPDGITTLGDGCLNELWRLDAGGDSFVLRRSRPSRSPDDLAYEHALLLAVAPELPWAVAPLPGAGHATVQVHAGRAFTLFPFVAGTAAAPERADHREALARALGGLHRVTARLALPRRPGRVGVADGTPWPAWPLVRPRIASRTAPEVLAFFDAEQAALSAWVDDLRRTRPDLGVGAIHGDLNPRNVLADEAQRGTIAGVVDWDDCRTEWYAWEVAQAAATFCRRPDGSPPTAVSLRPRLGLDPERLAAFLEAYRDVGGRLDAGDVRLLPEFMRLGTLNDVWWVLDDDEPDGISADADWLLRDVMAALTHLRAARL